MLADCDAIRYLFEKTLLGFEHYNSRVRNPGGFYLPNGAREGNFKTSNQKEQFTINIPASHHLEADEFLMMTIRSHDQYNTTIYGMDDRYRGIYNGRRVILMNVDDLVSAGIKKGDRVDLTSNYDGKLRQANDFLVVPYDIPERCVATYFPEANPLVPYNHFARGSQTPISKSVVIKVKKRS